VKEILAFTHVVQIQCSSLGYRWELHVRESLF
jgi:hypothetical protein